MLLLRPRRFKLVYNLLSQRQFCSKCDDPKDPSQKLAKNKSTDSPPRKNIENENNLGIDVQNKYKDAHISERVADFVKSVKSNQSVIDFNKSFHDNSAHYQKSAWKNLEGIKEKTLESQLFQQHLNKDNINRKFNDAYSLYEEKSGMANVRTAKEKVSKLIEETQANKARRAQLELEIAHLYELMSGLDKSILQASMFSKEHLELKGKHKEHMDALPPLLAERDLLKERERATANDVPLAINDIQEHFDTVKTFSSHLAFVATVLSVLSAFLINQRRERLNRAGLGEVKHEIVAVKHHNQTSFSGIQECIDGLRLELVGLGASLESSLDQAVHEKSVYDHSVYTAVESTTVDNHSVDKAVNKGVDGTAVNKGVDGTAVEKPIDTKAVEEDLTHAVALQKLASIEHKFTALDAKVSRIYDKMAATDQTMTQILTSISENGKVHGEKDLSRVFELATHPNLNKPTKNEYSYFVGLAALVGILSLALGSTRLV